MEYRRPNSGSEVTVEAEKQEQQYEEETTIAFEGTIKKAAVTTELVDRLASLAFSQLTYV